MPTYFFETITAAQALSFNASNDTLVFSNPTSSGSKTSVLYNPASATQAATVNFVAVQVGADVVVFADSAGNNGTADDAITLVGKTLADIQGANIIGH